MAGTPAGKAGSVEGMAHLSRFADADAACLAVSLALPSIERTLACTGISARRALHLVVLDAAAGWGSCGFEEALLHERSVGDPQCWDADHAAFARDKASLSWRHGMDSRQAVQQEPHWLWHEDDLLWGSVWLDGIVVAASGAMPAWDEAFSLCVAAHLRAIALTRSLGTRIA